MNVSHARALLVSALRLGVAFPFPTVFIRLWGLFIFLFP